MIISWFPCSRLGQVILHVYELELIQILKNQKLEIFIDRNIPFQELICQLLNNRNINNKIIKKNESGFINSYSICNEFKFKNSFYDSFHLINHLLERINLTQYNMDLSLSKETNNRLIENSIFSINSCIGISIRYRSPYTKEETNADISQWNYILEKYSNQFPSLKILLLGDDSKYLDEFPNIFSLSKRNFNLFEQLAISQNVGLFLGLASGFCTAANLYSNPYIIFKSPTHHADSINKELIQLNRLPMAISNQVFKIEIPKTSNILSILEKFSKP